MVEYRKNSHSVHDIQYHYVWVTKYRYQVLTGETRHRVREIIRQCCLANDIKIIKGSIGKDHIHVLVSCSPNLAPSKIIQLLKGRSSRMLQMEYSHLKKRYWGRHLWARGYFCATVGAVNKETIQQYIEGQQGEHDDQFELED